MSKNIDCPFCLEYGLLKTDILFQDDLWYFAAMNEGSITNGGMAITKRHVETPFDINLDEWQRLHKILPEIIAILSIKEPHGYNIGWNVYPTGGQHVMHAHLHIFARYDDEPLAGKGIRYAFKKASNLRPPKNNQL